MRGGAVLIQAAIGAVIIGAMLHLTFYFQIVLGMGPLVSGLANLAMTVVIMGFSPGDCREARERELAEWGVVHAEDPEICRNPQPSNGRS